jgi:hypothetical protein
MACVRLRIGVTRQMHPKAQYALPPFRGGGGRAIYKEAFPRLRVSRRRGGWGVGVAAGWRLRSCWKPPCLPNLMWHDGRGGGLTHASPLCEQHTAAAPTPAPSRGTGPPCRGAAAQVRPYGPSAASPYVGGMPRPRAHPARSTARRCGHTNRSQSSVTGSRPQSVNAYCTQDGGGGVEGVCV